jgi:hypothetical protein
LRPPHECRRLQRHFSMGNARYAQMSVEEHMSAICDSSALQR